LVEKIGTAIIGCGHIANAHASALASLGNSRLVAFCDVIEERARDFAQRYGGKKWYRDFNDLVRDPEVEAVSICTPHPLHAPPAIAAAEAGRHVIVEKPMAATLRQADAMVEACEKAGVRLGQIFQRRFMPACSMTKKAIEDGKMGQPIFVEAKCMTYRDKAYYEMDPWRGWWDREGGGVLMNQAPHEIDLMLWLAGSPVDCLFGVCENLTHPYRPIEDNAAAVLRFKSGAVGLLGGSVSVSHLPTFKLFAPNAYGGSEISVYGSNGSCISLRGIDPFWVLNWAIPGEEDKTDAWRRQQLGDKRNFHALQLQEFLEAIAEDREPAVTGRDGRNALEVIIAVYLSQKTGEKVAFPLTGDHPYYAEKETQAAANASP